MADPQQVLGARVRAALGDAFGAGYISADPLIRPSSFADFQSNAALPLAKKLDRKSTRLNSSHRSLSRMPSSA